VTAAAALAPPTTIRLAEIADRYGLDERGRAACCALLRALAEDEHAPTNVRDPAVAVDVHIADSLVALELDAVANAQTIADVGAGAGFPGLPLAAALPSATVWLVESAQRKVGFIAQAAARAKLDNAHAVATRVEQWRDGIGRNDVVTTRALAPLAVLAEYAAPLLRLGGALVAWKGGREPEEERAATAAARELGLEQAEVVPVRPYAASMRRHLYVYLKVAPTPEGFPRRPGIARKSPLGGPR
jgi:16S rRNA (guanine527-N7)-methyltransferase